MIDKVQCTGTAELLGLLGLTGGSLASTLCRVQRINVLLPNL